MKASDFGLLVALGAIWGMSYVFIRVASPVVGPIPLMAFRFGVAAAVLLGALVARGRGPAIWQGLRQGAGRFLVLGILLMALPTTLIGYAELEIPASLASVLNASVPFFAAAVAFLWLGDTLKLRQVGGLLLGFAGVAVAVGGVTVAAGWSILPFAAASVVAAASYGVASVYLRRANLPSSGVTSSASTQLMAALILAPLVPFTATGAPWAGPVLWAALGLALLSTALAYLIYFHLVRAVGPTQASTVTFISPVAGILGGAALLGEQIHPELLLGLGLIVVGILITTGLDVASFARGRRGAPAPPAPAR